MCYRCHERLIQSRKSATQGVIWKRLYSSTDQVCVTCSVMMRLHLNKKSSHLFNLRFLYLLQSDSDLLSFLFGSLFLLNIHIRTRSPHGNTFWIIVTLIIAWSKHFPVVKHLDIYWFPSPHIYLAFPARCHCLFRPWRTIQALVQKHKKQGKGLKTSSTMTSVDKHNLLLIWFC